MIIFLISLLLNSCGSSNSFSKSSKNTPSIQTDTREDTREDRRADTRENPKGDSRTTPSFVNEIKQNNTQTNGGIPKEDTTEDRKEDKKPNNSRDPLLKELKEKVRFKEWQKTVKSYKYDQYINTEKADWEYFNRWIEETGQQDRALDEGLLYKYYQDNYKNTDRK